MTAQRPDPAAVQRLAAQLAPAFGARLLASPSTLQQYAQSESYHVGAAPDLAVQPETIGEVQAIVRAAGAEKIPVVGWGVGTSLEGNAAAIHGGLTVDFSRMNKVLEIAAEDLLCVVQPGVTREQLDRELRATGLFFPVDPGADATIGGMVSTRASGTTTVKYGSVRDNILTLKVVLPDGTLVSTGSRARKSAAGYDLTHLFTGAEGTLGLIVEAGLRLHGRPENVLSAVWDFESFQGAIDTVIATIQCGVGIARMEFVDPAAIAACNAYSGLDLAAKPTLFLEFHGSAAETAAQLDMVQAIGADHGGGTLRHAQAEEDRSKLWRARHQALTAARHMRAGAVVWITDICVPISRLAETLALATQGIKAAGLTAPIVGHVGDGNFHVFFVLDPDDKAQWEKARDVNAAMVTHALSVGGTCTGEHGIGLGKKHDLVREHGQAAVDLMARIKQAIDPDQLMNPGKIFL